MKIKEVFYSILDAIGFGKKVSNANLENPDEGKTGFTDMLGNVLDPEEKVIPILYNEIARLGYVTIGPEYDRQAIKAANLNDYYIKRGVLKLSDFLNGLDNHIGLAVEESHRRGFFHVYIPTAKVLPQYRHRTA